MKVSTKFLLVVAAAALTIPLTAADCVGEDGGEGEGEGEEGEGEEGEGEVGEGEGEEARACESGGGFANATGDFLATADGEFTGPDAVSCTGAAGNLIDIAVVIAEGDAVFGDPLEIGNGDVELSINGGAPTSCTNSPGISSAGGFIVVLCPLCIEGDEFPADFDVAIQVTDSAGDVSPALCVDEAE